MNPPHVDLAYLAPLKIVGFPGGHASGVVRPLITPDTEPHHEALTRGALLLPRCDACARMRLPATPACTWCGGTASTWSRATGQGRVHSWVRYHRAYLPEFAALVPYAVLAVQLDEGPVAFGRLVAGPAGASTPPDAPPPRIGQPARAVVERWADGFCGLAFELAEATR
ncbi:MAG TPA: OB-fold domain-containing protein [Burkholderiaceae bacterium]|jgi:hypothetical protein